MTGQNRKTCPNCGQGWRDRWIWDRHRRWGKDVPVTDVDSIGWEYDLCKIIALIEYKHRDAPGMEWAQLTTMLNTADELMIPAYKTEFMRDDETDDGEPLFWVTPLNPLADWITPGGWIPEEQYVGFLHEIRGRAIRSWETSTLRAYKARLKRVRREMEQRGLSESCEPEPKVPAA